jgi:uncharacterized protein
MCQDRSFLILHGLGHHRPRGHWQWWLAQQLLQRGEQVLYPQLPDPDAPDLARWLDVLAAQYRRMAGCERIVVCHSLACALWYQASARGIVTPPADRALLVAPPGRKVLARPVTREFDPGVWKPGVLDASCRAGIRLVASGEDPYCPEGPAALIYGKPLGLDSETVAGGGHLTPAEGYGPWPHALMWCLNSDVRFSGRPQRHSPRRPDGQIAAGS